MKKSIELIPINVEDGEETYIIQVIPEIQVNEYYYVSAELEDNIIVYDNSKPIDIGTVIIEYDGVSSASVYNKPTTLDYTNLIPEPKSTNIVVNSIVKKTGSPDKPDKGETTHKWNKPPEDKK